MEAMSDERRGDRRKRVGTFGNRPGYVHAGTLPRSGIDRRVEDRGREARQEVVTVEYVDGGIGSPFKLTTKKYSEPRAHEGGPMTPDTGSREKLADVIRNCLTDECDSLGRIHLRSESEAQALGARVALRVLAALRADPPEEREARHKRERLAENGSAESCCCSCKNPAHRHGDYGERCARCGKHRPPGGRISWVDDSWAPAPDVADVEGELAEMVAFLCGEAPLDGLWFGDTPDDGSKYPRRYWWRKRLRALAARLRRTQVEEGERVEGELLGWLSSKFDPAHAVVEHDRRGVEFVPNDDSVDFRAVGPAILTILHPEEPTDE